MSRNHKVIKFLGNSDKKKLELISKGGILLMSRDYSTTIVSLYSLEDFYVEVRASKVSGKTETTMAFTDTKLLNPYLSKIDISKIK